MLFLTKRANSTPYIKKEYFCDFFGNWKNSNDLESFSRQISDDYSQDYIPENSCVISHQKSNLDSAIEKGLAIYSELYGRKPPEERNYKNFVETLAFLSDEENISVAFKVQSVRVRIKHDAFDFIIDYDYGTDDSVFVTKDDKSETLKVAECDLKSLCQKMMEMEADGLPERIIA